MFLGKFMNEGDVMLPWCLVESVKVLSVLILFWTIIGMRYDEFHIIKIDNILLLIIFQDMLHESMIGNTIILLTLCHSIGEGNLTIAFANSLVFGKFVFI